MKISLLTFIITLMISGCSTETITINRYEECYSQDTGIVPNGAFLKNKNGEPMWCLEIFK